MNDLVFISLKYTIRSKSIYMFFGKIYSENGVSPEAAKINDLDTLLHLACKKELQEILSLLTNTSPFYFRRGEQEYVFA